MPPATTIATGAIERVMKRTKRYMRLLAIAAEISTQTAPSRSEKRPNSVR